MAARPERTKSKRPARASGLHLARHFRRSAVRAGGYGALARRLGVPRPHGSGERLGTEPGSGVTTRSSSPSACGRPSSASSRAPTSC